MRATLRIILPFFLYFYEHVFQEECSLLIHRYFYSRYDWLLRARALPPYEPHHEPPAHTIVLRDGVRDRDSRRNSSPVMSPKLGESSKLSLCRSLFFIAASAKSRGFNENVFSSSHLQTSLGRKFRFIE